MHNIFEFIVDRKRLDMNSLYMCVSLCVCVFCEKMRNAFEFMWKVADVADGRRKRKVWLTHAQANEWKVACNSMEKRNKITEIDSAVIRVKKESAKSHKWVIHVNRCPIANVHVNQPHPSTCNFLLRCVCMCCSLYSSCQWYEHDEWKSYKIAFAHILYIA